MGYSEKQKQYLDQLQLIDSNSYRKIDFRLLSDKYIDRFSPYELYILEGGSVPLLNCDDKKLDVLLVAINYFEKDDNYTKYISKVLASYKSCECDELLKDIDIKYLSDDEKRNLMMILLSENAMNAKDKNDLDNLDLCLENATKLDKNETNIEKIKEVVILKKYGINSILKTKDG